MSLRNLFDSRQQGALCRFRSALFEKMQFRLNLLFCPTRVLEFSAQQMFCNERRVLLMIACDPLFPPRAKKWLNPPDRCLNAIGVIARRPVPISH